MANHENLKESLLPGSSVHDDHKKNVVKRRRFRRYRSAPLIDYIPGEENGASSTQRSDYLYGGLALHPSFRKVAAFLCIYFGIGIICFYVVKNQISGKKTNGIVDALYFCMVTMTTVGYGDLVPQSVLAKLLACAFVFSGMALVGLILSEAADYLVEKQEILIVRALHARKKLGPSDFMNEISTNKTRYKFVLVLVFLLILIVIGTMFLTLVEELDIVDAFYCVCVTITTLGYGDNSFSTEGGRVFAVLWILTSTICLAQFFLYVAELNTEKRQNALVERVLNRPVTNEDLEAADLDNDGVVDEAEFVLYKLEEMGKITREDVLLVRKEFKELDVDQSGTLSSCDVNLAQSSPETATETSDRERL